MATIDLDEIEHRRTPEEEKDLDDLVKGPSRISKHDSYVNKLKSEIEDFYDSIILNYTFFAKSRHSKRIVTRGEVDIIGIKGRTVDAFEVKCSNRVSKARQQLKKIKKRLGKEFDDKKINTFFYCGSSDMLKQIT